MLEEAVTSETLGISEIEHGNNSISRLTERELEVLIEAAKDNYSGGFISHVAKVLGIAERTVKNHLANIRKKLRVHDTFSAVYRALHYGFISVDAIAEEAHLQSRLDRLTTNEREVLMAYAINALNKGYISEKNIAPILGISPKTLERYISLIHDKLRIHNNAQLAVFAYVHMATLHQPT